MQIPFLPLTFFLVVFFFSLFIQSKDDFVFLKKNISMEKIFNSAFLFLLSALLFARVIYVAFHFDFKFLNPFVFFLFPYFPGLSLLGALLGGVIFITVYFKPPKNPRLRMFDFFSTAFLFSYTTGFLFRFTMSLLANKHIVLIIVGELLFLISISSLFFLYLIPRQRRGELQEGSLGLIFYCLLCPIIFFQEQAGKSIVFLSAENVFILITFFLSLALFLKKERIISKIFFQG